MFTKILKFNLSGAFAFFKNPEVNSNYYFTFNNIHKVALLGILGSILGLKGYNQQNKDDEYPEFYDKLKDLNIAIVPKNDVCPNKKIQTFNNSTMFFNKGASSGANLIVTEEWIEKPSWDIYIKINEENPLEKDLLSRIVEYRYVYVPYLGKNDHFANITEIEVFDKEDVKIISDGEFKLDSFYLRGDYQDAELDMDEEGDVIFKYREHLPFALNSQTNHYEYKVVEYSNGKLESANVEIKTYNIGAINISFM